MIGQHTLTAHRLKTCNCHTATKKDGYNFKISHLVSAIEELRFDCVRYIVVNQNTKSPRRFLDIMIDCELDDTDMLDLYFEVTGMQTITVDELSYMFHCKKDIMIDYVCTNRLVSHDDESVITKDLDNPTYDDSGRTYTSRTIDLVYAAWKYSPAALVYLREIGFDIVYTDKVESWIWERNDRVNNPQRYEMRCRCDMVHIPKPYIRQRKYNHVKTMLDYNNDRLMMAWKVKSDYINSRRP